MFYFKNLEFFDRSFILKNKINLIFASFCLLHLLIWTLAPSLIYANPPTDSLEGIAWGNLWLWGYSKHPPLAPWLSAAFTDFFGTVGWPLYLLSQLSVLTCFIAIFQLGKKMLPAYYALIGVMLLEGINFYNIESAIFNPNVLMLPLWGLMTLFFYQALIQNRWRDWLLLGVCAGLALLTKYESALLILIMFMFLVYNAKTRVYLRQLPVYVAATIGFLIFLPNLIWLFDHQFVAVQYALTEMKTAPTTFWFKIYKLFARPLYFFIEQLGAIALMFLLYLPFYNQKDSEVSVDQFNYRFLCFMALGPMIFTMAMSLIFQTELVSRWAFPFFSTLGLFLVATLKPSVTTQNMQTFFKIIGIYMSILIITMVFYFIYLPIFKNRDMHSDSFPGKQVALTLTQEWHERFQSPLMYVAGDHHVAVNVVSFSPDKPKAYFNCNAQESPWINEEDLKNKGGIFIVRLLDDAAIERIKNLQVRYPGMISSERSFQRITKAKVAPVKLWIGYLPPKKM